MMEIYSQNPKPENNAGHFAEKTAGCLHGDKAAGFAMNLIAGADSQTDVRSNADISANAGGSANTYAYVRVSAKDQNEARQLAAMSALGIPRKRIYTDKQSGKDFERPAYKRLMGKLKPGDLLVIGSIDRLGRNYKEILEQWSLITKEKGVRIRVLDMPILDTGYCSDLTRTLIADIVLQLLSYVAQKERENIRSRQAEGIAAAKARGVRFGRKEAELPDDFEEWYLRWRRKEITGKELSDHLGVHITTVYHRARKLGLISHSRSEKESPNSTTEA